LEVCVPVVGDFLGLDTTFPLALAPSEQNRHKLYKNVLLTYVVCGSEKTAGVLELSNSKTPFVKWPVFPNKNSPRAIWLSNGLKVLSKGSPVVWQLLAVDSTANLLRLPI
jgi:hypothetical protein